MWQGNLLGICCMSDARDDESEEEKKAAENGMETELMNPHPTLSLSFRPFDFAFHLIA